MMLTRLQKAVFQHAQYTCAIDTSSLPVYFITLLETQSRRSICQCQGRNAIGCFQGARRLSGGARHADSRCAKHSCLRRITIFRDFAGRGSHIRIRHALRLTFCMRTFHFCCPGYLFILRQRTIQQRNQILHGLHRCQRFFHPRPWFLFRHKQKCLHGVCLHGFQIVFPGCTGF